ncbi:MAG: hypothetical protein R2822_28995 [Spirosomataceae bacterium]
MMGIALVIYLNSSYRTPRTQLYLCRLVLYFAFWIGLGVLFIYDFLTKILPSSTARAGMATVLGLTAPLLMGIKAGTTTTAAIAIFG